MNNLWMMTILIPYLRHKYVSPVGTLPEVTKFQTKIFTFIFYFKLNFITVFHHYPPSLPHSCRTDKDYPVFPFWTLPNKRGWCQSSIQKKKKKISNTYSRLPELLVCLFPVTDYVDHHTWDPSPVLRD